MNRVTKLSKVTAFFTLAFILVSGSTALPDGLWLEISGDAIYGGNADTLDVNKGFTITVWVTASDSAIRSLWSTPFKFAGTGNVTTLSSQNYFVDTILSCLNEIGGQVVLESWDGDLTISDKCGYLAESVNTGWDIYGSYRAFVFDFSIAGDSATEGAFCIDSGNFAYSEFDWLFAPPELPWTGKCWPVKMSTSSQFTCGDANDDGAVNLLDITFLISYLYRAGPPPEPPEAADVNSSGNINLLDITYLINCLYKGGPAPDCPSEAGPAGSLIDYDGCKEFKGEKSKDYTPPDQDCMEYQYDGESTLLLKHVNAGFNCCPGTIVADISIEGNIITIVEDEVYDSLGPCYCLCLFDVEFQIINLQPGEYAVKVVELYLVEGDDPLKFDINLSSSPSGSFCVDRNHYPWEY